MGSGELGAFRSRGQTTPSSRFASREVVDGLGEPDSSGVVPWGALGSAGVDIRGGKAGGWRRRGHAGAARALELAQRGAGGTIGAGMVGSRIAFADESGTEWSSKCYAIGALSLDARRLDGLNRCFLESKQRHGLGNHEVHWKKLANSHGLVNFCIEWFSRVLRSSSARFDVIVVNTTLYEDWMARDGDREQAFYKTYTQLLRCLPRDSGASVDVRIDDRKDGYAKHDEAMLRIGNNMLAQLQSAVSLSAITKVSSREHPGVQLADVLTGAVRSAHAILLDPKYSPNSGKRLAIERMARVVGWDGLHFDTFPPGRNKSRLNIWHFPKEYRGPSREVSLIPEEDIPWVLPADLVPGER